MGETLPSGANNSFYCWNFVYETVCILQLRINICTQNSWSILKLYESANPYGYY